MSEDWCQSYLNALNQAGTWWENHHRIMQEVCLGSFVLQILSGKTLTFDLELPCVLSECVADRLCYDKACICGSDSCAAGGYMEWTYDRE